MKIYFACAITGGRQDEAIYQQLVKVMVSEGCEVLTAHIAETGIEELDAAEDAGDIYDRDVQWIGESDLLIAEISTPSHGVGYEIGYALALEIPVVCFHHHQAAVSKMILGNPHPLLSVSSYQSPEEAVQLLRQSLK